MIFGQEISIWIVPLAGVLFGILTNFALRRTQGFLKPTLYVISAILLILVASSVIWGDMRRSILFSFFLLLPEYAYRLRRPLRNIISRTAKYSVFFVAFSILLWQYSYSWVRIDTLMSVNQYAGNQAETMGFAQYVVSYIVAFILNATPSGKMLLVDIILAMLAIAVTIPRIREVYKYWTSPASNLPD